MKRKAAMWIGLMTAIGFAPDARASEWSTWMSFGNGVSVSFAQMDKTMCTWRFRNDASRVIGSMDFSYVYVDAATGRSISSADLIPFALKPGEVYGGWSVYSASTRNCSSVRIRLKDVTWK